MFCKLLTMLPLAAALTLTAADGKNGKKHHNEKEKHASVRDKWGDSDAVQYRSRSERERFYEYQNRYGWPRATQGHVPHDLNGDGLITRREWPGNSVSFRRMDRNGDGIITDADRQLTSRR